MPGFPTKPSRLSFGPTYSNRFPVQESDKEIGEGIFNQLFWQVAGLGVIANIAKAQAVVDGAGAATLGLSAEAWDADGGFAPTLVDVGVGIFRFEYPATVSNETGAAVTIAFLDAKAHVLATSTSEVPFVATCEIDANGRFVTVKTYSLTTGLIADPVNQSVVVEIY